MKIFRIILILMVVLMWSTIQAQGVVSPFMSGPRQMASPSTGTGNPVPFVTTNVIGEGGKITPVNRAVPLGKSGDFTIKPDAGFTYTVTGCGGTLSGTTYTVSPPADCVITVTFGKALDDTAPEPILMLTEPTNVEYLSGATTSVSTNCPYEGMGVPNWRYKSYPPKQISGPPTTLRENWMNYWYSFNLPATIPAGETQEVVYQCSGTNEAGHLVTYNQVHTLRGFPKKIFATNDIASGKGPVHSPVMQHSGKYGTRLYFTRNGSPSDVKLANGANLSPLTYPVIGSGNLPTWTGGVAVPQTVFFRKGHHLWFNGLNGYGHATSDDGESWVVDTQPTATGMKLVKVVPFKGADLVYVRESSGVYKVGKSLNGAPATYEPVVFGSAWMYTESRLNAWRQTMAATRVVYNNVEYVLIVAQHGTAGTYVFLSADGVTFRAEQNFMWGPPVNTQHVIHDISVANGKLVTCGTHPSYYSGTGGVILCDARLLAKDLLAPGYTHTNFVAKPNYDENK